MLLLYAGVVDLVLQFGLESILIYTAALLKKRIVVYASSLDSLLKTCRFIIEFQTTDSMLLAPVSFLMVLRVYKSPHIIRWLVVLSPSLLC